MMKYLLWIFAVILIVTFESCKNDDDITPDNNNGGIAINFDGEYISQYYWADSILSGYNWKTTINVPYFDKLSDKEIQQLHELKNKGHEIGGKGLNYLNAEDYFLEGRMDEYVNTEIIPMIELMESEGFTVKTFAYPYGRRNEQTDSVLLNYFDILRGVAWGGNFDISDHNCFFDQSQVVDGLGIDTSYPYFDGRDYDQYILDLLTYARDNDKILIIFCSRIVKNITEDYQTKISTLNLIANFVRENNMRYVTMSELKTMNK